MNRKCLTGLAGHGTIRLVEPLAAFMIADLAFTCTLTRPAAILLSRHSPENSQMRICVVCVLILLAGSLIEGSWAQARPINVPLYGDFKYRLPFALPRSLRPSRFHNNRLIIVVRISCIIRTYQWARRPFSTL